MSGSPKWTYLAVEGRSDQVILTKLLKSLDVCILGAFSKGGKVELLRKLNGYNQNARFAPWLVVLDLDQDAECAPSYARSILPSPNKKMMLRFAVRSIESWLLADIGRMARFLKIKAENFPRNPDAEDDPKQSLIDLVNQKCNSRSIRQDMLPHDLGETRVGPGYISRMEDFAINHWRPAVAAERSDSLARCIRALEDLKRQSAQ